MEHRFCVSCFYFDPFGLSRGPTCFLTHSLKPFYQDVVCVCVCVCALSVDLGKQLSLHQVGSFLSLSGRQIQPVEEMRAERS